MARAVPSDTMPRISPTSRVAPRRRVTSKSAAASRSRPSVAAKRRALRMASAAWPTSVSSSSRSSAPRRRGRADTNESTPSRRPSWMMGTPTKLVNPWLCHQPVAEWRKRGSTKTSGTSIIVRWAATQPTRLWLSATRRTVALVQPGIREGARLDHLLRGVGRPDPRRGAAKSSVAARTMAPRTSSRSSDADTTWLTRLSVRSRSSRTCASPSRRAFSMATAAWSASLPSTCRSASVQMRRVRVATPRTPVTCPRKRSGSTAPPSRPSAAMTPACACDTRGSVR